MSESAVNRKRGGHGDGLAVAALIAVLAVGLSFGMEGLGVLDAFDGWIASMLGPLGADGGWQEVGDGVTWPMLGLVSLGLAYAMIETPAAWRRAVLWLSCGALLAGAVPVAALAARWLAPGAPLVAWLWTGVCGLVYAHRHEPQAGGGNGG